MSPQSSDAPEAFPVRGFTTSNRRSAERTQAWAAFARERVLATQSTSLSADGAVISLRQIEPDGVLISEGASNEFIVQRTPADISAHPSDTVMLTLLLSGSAFHHHRGGTVVLEPGDALVLDSDQPGIQGYSTASRVLSIRLPRALFTLRTGERAIPEPRIVRRMVTSGGHGPDDERIARLRGALRGRIAADHVRDDAIACLVAACGGKRHVTLARQFILDHLADTGLSVRRVAQGLSVSERQLARSFAAENATVAATITELRLARGRAMLRDPAWRTHTIGEIAEKVGYGSPSSFAHVFRRQYGHSPSDERPRTSETRPAPVRLTPPRRSEPSPWRMPRPR